MPRKGLLPPIPAKVPIFDPNEVNIGALGAPKCQEAVKRFAAVNDRGAGPGLTVARAVGCVLRDCATHRGDLLFKEKEEPFRAYVVAHMAATNPELLRFNRRIGCAPLQVELPLSIYGKTFRGRADLAVLGKASRSERHYWATPEERHYVPDVHVEFKRNMLHSRRAWRDDPFNREFRRLNRIHRHFARQGHHVSGIIAWPARWPVWDNAGDFGASTGEVERQEKRYKNLRRRLDQAGDWLTLMHVEYAGPKQYKVVVEGEFEGRLRDGECPLGIASKS